MRGTYPAEFDSENLLKAVKEVENFPGLEVKYHPKTAEATSALEASNRDFSFRIYFRFASSKTSSPHISQLIFEMGKAWAKDLYYDATGSGGYLGPGTAGEIPGTFDAFLEVGLSEHGIALEDFKRWWDPYRKYPKSYRTFGEFYDTFMKALYPPFARSGLHTGAEEYVECIAADDEAIMRCLKLK